MGVYIGTTIGLLEGDTKSFGYGSYPELEIFIFLLLTGSWHRRRGIIPIKFLHTILPYSKLRVTLETGQNLCFPSPILSAVFVWMVHRNNYRLRNLTHTYTNSR